MDQVAGVERITLADSLERVVPLKFSVFAYYIQTVCIGASDGQNSTTHIVPAHEFDLAFCIRQAPHPNLQATVGERTKICPLIILIESEKVGSVDGGPGLQR